MKNAIDSILFGIIGTIIMYALVSIAAINIKTETTTLVKITTTEQLNIITNGNTPDIIFTSLTDTSFSDNIKVLKTMAHPILSEVIETTKDPIHKSLTTPDEHISNWLKQNSITEMSFNEITYQLSIKGGK